MARAAVVHERPPRASAVRRARQAAAAAHEPPRGRLASLVHRLFEPVDILSLVALRMTFGLIMAWEAYRYFDHGWISRYFAEPTFHFTYLGFGWVEPWPERWMHLHFAALGVLGVFVALGFMYRISTVLFLVGFTYVFLLEQARYLNHFYFIILVALVLAVVPAHRAYSVDAWLRPGLRSPTVPTWALWLVRAQIGLVFCLAGVAKLNVDWLRGEPLRMWLGERTDFAVIGRFFDEAVTPYLFSYGGLLFDLFVVFFLLVPRTRPFAFLGAITFHGLNSELFQIGIFPWIALASMLIFFPPDWPRRLGAVLRRQRPPRPDPPRLRARSRVQLTTVRKVGVGLMAAWLAFQVLVPLRHFVYPGNVSWTEEGHQFAWHMKLRDKAADAGFVVQDPATGETWEVDPFLYLTDWQYSKMAARPDMVLQFAHHVRDQMALEGIPNVRVFAVTQASLNGREPQELVDPEVDLAAEERSVLPADWIVPLDRPLR